LFDSPGVPLDLGRSSNDSSPSASVVDVSDPDSTCACKSHSRAESAVVDTIQECAFQPKNVQINIHPEQPGHRKFYESLRPHEDVRRRSNLNRAVLTSPSSQK
jgi:hypothetical protein